jgi:murein DD-endopeptidase MepM/ murein hydrolase activator NlpD
MKNKEVHVGDVLEVPSVSGVLYEIRKGDTLAGLAKKYSVDLDDVTLYNGLLPSDDLAVGDEVFLPGAKEVEVVKIGTKTSTKVVKASRSTRGQWANGDTAHLNTSGDIAKYSSLPKYAGYYMMPVPGAVRTQKLHGHNGVDLAAPIGSTVVASAGGVVRVAKNSGYNFGLGNYIIISHDNGTETVYGHLLHADVSAGQTVARGQAIGRLGSSGNSTGPHTHFEIHGAYNPFAW